MRSSVLQIADLINSLRYYKIKTVGDVSSSLSDRTVSSVEISPTAQTYLADVEHRCVLVTESLDQMWLSADRMLNIVLGTISASQHETIEQLIFIVILFLLVTLIIGCFSMEPSRFMVALLVVFGIAVIWRCGYFVSTTHRSRIFRNRRWRL